MFALNLQGCDLQKTRKLGGSSIERVYLGLGTEPEYIGANLYLCQDNACMRSGPCGSPRDHSMLYVTFDKETGAISY